MARREQGSDPGWVTLAWVCRETGHGPRLVQDWARRGLIGTLKVGDHPTKYCSADVRQLLRESTRPATARREMAEVM
jgi:hypothetical protein